MNRLLPMISLAMLLAGAAQAQPTESPLGTVVAPHAVGPTAPGWESGYQARLLTLVNARAWPIGSGGNGDPDDGKREWPSLLAEMWKVRDNPAQVQSFLQNQGRTLLFSRWAGSFFKPFSDPGYTLYYLRYKERLPPDQIARAHTMIQAGTGTADPFRSGWTYLTRTDGHMDPIYGLTEFNSENFNWMARLMGCLWAHELDDPAQMAYFDNYVDNWVRALFNAGRVEWNSNNYWGYTFQPLLVLYEFAPNPKIKAQAKAALDWMVFEAALHFLDGFQVGPDVRAKGDAYKSFAGSVWPYAYLYFVDDAHRPTYRDADVQANMQRNLVGFMPYASYRPPQVAIDIAQRRFALPVEIHSAKPFYHLDNDNYAGWRGDTERGRRWEFETLYLDQHYTLGSLATFRPNGEAVHRPENQRPFSEQSVWRLGVRGTTRGAIQVFGNAGPDNDLAGRCPHEQIGQDRNTMLRLTKNTDRMWVALPSNRTIEFDGDRTFCDLNNNVYVALLSHNARDRTDNVWSPDTAYRQIVWRYDPARLGALVLEVGTQKEHGSFGQFKQNVASRSRLTVIDADQIEYTGTSGRRLKMQYQPTTTYTMVDGTVINPAGVVPKVWTDGVYQDYLSWDSYRVVHGPSIIEQPWGGGVLKASAAGRTLQITIDPFTAAAGYRQSSRNLTQPGQQSTVR